MRQNPARPEQSQSPIEIIRAALRDAAIQSSPNQSIDVLADALLRLDAIARVVVNHG